MIEPTPQSRAFAEQYRNAFLRLRKMFVARGVPREEAADLAQEAAARLLVHLERNGVDPLQDDLTPLLNRIAANLLIDHMRASARKVISLDEIDLQEGESDPVNEVERRQRSSVIRRAIEDLPERQREALMLSLDGHGPAEIAKHLGLQRNAADALLYRARRSLADRLNSLRGDLHTLVLVALWRVRSMMKRGDAGNAFAAMSPAFAGVVSAALGMALSLQPGAAAAHALPDPMGKTTTARVSAMEADLPARVIASAGGSHGVDTDRTGVDVRRHRASVHTSVPGADGRRTPLGVDVWQEREGDRGTAGPLLDDLTDTACEFMPCSTPGG